ncbi:glycosyltransferase family 2 protein [[Mycoplasma] collis]|uniref:glycosyltransferase family 2 protein n=1 Tax=[Mycoplasma] collis TaxID=2127 RepID=UPI00051B8C78|nr:glycosyltransferase [[Mycoplasma] collis]
MKLSILLSVYKQKNEIHNLLDSLSKQTSKNFEIILVINSPSAEELEILHFYKTSMMKKLKIIINDKRQIFFNDFYKMLSMAKGEYFVFVSAGAKIETNFVEMFIKYSTQFSVDLLEFRLSYKGYLDFDLRQRIEEKKILKISENKNVLAYILPVFFNKFFNRTKFIEIKNKIQITNPSNQKIWIDLIYKIILNLKNFVYIHHVLISEWNNKSIITNPNALIKDWNNIENYVKNNNPEFIYEIQFNKIYTLALFVPLLLSSQSHNKIKRLIFKTPIPISTMKYYENLKTIRINEFSINISINKYFLENEWETNIISKDLAPNKWQTLTRKL